MISPNKIVLFGFLLLMACSDEETPVKKFTVSGTVTEGGQGISGISILKNNEAAATTSSTGNYTIENLEAGSYTIKADQAGRTFTPSEIMLTLSDANSDGHNFARVPENQIVHKDQTWSLFNPAVYSVKQNNSAILQLDLAQNALWYQGSQGGLIYRSVTGDFTITATVNAVRKSDNGQPVACNVCLGGLMARSPDNSSGENYVHLVTGFTPNDLGFETKNTTNSVSPYEATSDGSAKHDLRIQRVGSTFTLYQKLTTETDWKVAATFNRTDLPATLLVGINIYTAQGGAVADLSVIYENILIE